MSANGTFSTTLDYDFFGGGSVITGGEAQGNFDLSLVTAGQVIVKGQASGTIPFSVLAGAALPIVEGTADVSFGFTGSATADFGVQIFGESEYRNNLEFTQSAAGEVIVKGQLDQALDFNFKGSFVVVQDIQSSDISISFSVEATGINAPTISINKTGANIVTLTNDYTNSMEILVQSNDMKIVQSGANGVRILQP